MSHRNLPAATAAIGLIVPFQVMEGQLLKCRDQSPTLALAQVGNLLNHVGPIHLPVATEGHECPAVSDRSLPRGDCGV